MVANLDSSLRLLHKEFVRKSLNKRKIGLRVKMRISVDHDFLETYNTPKDGI